MMTEETTWDSVRVHHFTYIAPDSWYIPRYFKKRYVHTNAEYFLAAFYSNYKNKPCYGISRYPLAYIAIYMYMMVGDTKTNHNLNSTKNWYLKLFSLQRYRTPVMRDGGRLSLPAMRRGLSPEGCRIRERHSQGSLTIGVQGVTVHPAERGEPWGKGEDSLTLPVNYCSKTYLPCSCTDQVVYHGTHNLVSSFKYYNMVL